MSKNLVVNIITVVIISTIITWLYMFNGYFIDNEEKVEIKEETSIEKMEEIASKSNTWVLTEAQKLSIKEKKSRIDTIKKKLALKWLIMKWDMNIQNQEYTTALTKYLKVHKEVPDDKETIKKLWDIYFFLKKFKNSYSFYQKIKDYEKLEKDKLVLALIFSKVPSWESLDEIITELESIDLEKEKLFYYRNALNCEKNFTTCIQNFKKYIDDNETIKIDELKSIKKALKTYKNFEVDDPIYKKALITWAFFENWLYPIAIKTSNKILNVKSDYKPVLKINAKSYYELWDYINAKINLLKYYKIVKEDPEASYFLWVIYEKLREYVLSTIHFKRALKTWYENTYEANKRILYNYYELWEIWKMLETLETILKEDEATEIDYNMAIFYHIVNGKIDKSLDFTKIAIEKYKKNEIFYWYYWWILIEKESDIKANDENTYKVDKDYTEAEEYIEKWLKINKISPMLNFVKAKLELAKWNTDKAIEYFKKTASSDINWDFWTLSKTELEKLQ